MKSVLIFAGSVAITFGFIYWSYVGLQDYCSNPSVHSSPNEPERWRDRQGNTERTPPSTLVSNAYANTGNGTGDSYKEKWNREFFCDVKGSGFALGWATIFLVLVTGGLIWIGLNQEQSMRAIERAYVFPEISNGDGPIHTPSGNAPWNIAVNFWNSGKTPAIIRQIRGYARPIPSNEPLPRALLQFPGSENEIAPGMAIPKDTCFPDIVQARLSDDEWGRIERGDSILFVMGRIQYDDVFGRRRKTGHCWQYRWHMQQGRFIISQNTDLNYYT